MVNVAWWVPTTLQMLASPNPIPHKSGGKGRKKRTLLFTIQTKTSKWCDLLIC